MVDHKIAAKAFINNVTAIFFKTSYLLVIAIIFINLNRSLANEEPAKTDNGHGEAAKGEEAKGEAAPPAPSAWIETEIKVQNLLTKIKMKQENLKALIQEKAHLHDGSHRLKSLLGEISKTHNEYRQDAEEYQRQITLLRYRYPERMLKRPQKFEKIEVESIEEMERTLSLDDKLTRNLKRAKNKMAAPETLKKENAGSVKTNGKVNQSKGAHVESSRPPESVNKSDQLSIEEAPPVILKK